MAENSLVEFIGAGYAVDLRRDRYWKSVREAGRYSRAKFTDQLKAFCAYTDPRGDQSSDPEQAYMRLTTALYTPLGLTGKTIKRLREAGNMKVLRDHMPERALFALSILEDDLADYLHASMKRGDLRSTIKAHLRDEAKKAAAFCGLQPKAKPASRKIVEAA